MRTRKISAAATLIVAAAACSTSDQTTTDSAAGALATTDTVIAKCSGDNAGLTLPAGVCATIFADSIGHGRHVAVASNGDVYVTLEGTDPSEKTGSPAAVVALRDTTRDGRADVTARIGTTGNTGIALANGYLYVDEGSRIVRYKRADDELTPSGPREVVVQNLPLLPGHRARNIAIGSDGALYVNVGSHSNSCQKRDRTVESPGNDPCTELETRAGIWRFDANKAGQTFSREARFASGIRNGMAMTIRPNDGALFVAVHGRDQLHDSWPKVFPTTQYQAENPAEELLQVSQGDDFGWPYCYYSTEYRKKVLAPEYGGDGRKVGRCAEAKDPLVAFPAHWAPLALAFSTGDAFGPEYREGLFVAFHGSWNRAPRPQSGYRVAFVPMKNGAPADELQTFAIGGTATALRASGLAVGADGSLFISSDGVGKIWKVVRR